MAIQRTASLVKGTGIVGSKLKNIWRDLVTTVGKYMTSVSNSIGKASADASGMCVCVCVCGGGGGVGCLV